MKNHTPQRNEHRQISPELQGKTLATGPVLFGQIHRSSLDGNSGFRLLGGLPPRLGAIFFDLYASTLALLRSNQGGGYRYLMAGQGGLYGPPNLSASPGIYPS